MELNGDISSYLGEFLHETIEKKKLLASFLIGLFPNLKNSALIVLFHSNYPSI